MKKNYLLAVALALTAMVSCTDESFVGDQGLKEANEGVGAISFNLNTPAVTRADKTGSAAATDLSNQFIVYGEKGSITNAAPTAGNLVFPNYQVNYTDGSGYQTTSNTKGWEYVGATHSTEYQSNIMRKATSDAAAVGASGDAQTIKYWDWGADYYIFTAVSAANADITAGRVVIQKNEYGTTEYDKGYTITLRKTTSPDVYPDLTKLYFADRNVISKSTNTNRDAVNTYGGNVTFKFRNLLSHVRVGMYETVPGYSVTIDKFHYKNDGTPATFAEMKADGHTANSTTAFVANASNLETSNEATLTITYKSSGETVNQPTVAISGATAATNLTLGTNIPGTALGESVTAARFDYAAADTYTPFFPQETNAVPLKLMVDYTLTAPVTGETITVEGATAEIPAEYLQWKPNFKYTYIFKISDNTNGYTGETSDPAGLYPITFDAIEVVAEDGMVEYITTVSEPSITTFGAIYNTSTSKYTAYQTGKDEYQVQPSGKRLDIYATIVQNNAVVSPTDKYAVYTVTSGATEAQVAEAVAEKIIRGASLTPTITCTPYITGVSVVTSVPAEDGTTKDITGAIKMEGPAAATYAVEYKVSDGSATATTEAYDASKTYYSVSAGTKGFYSVATPSSEDITNWETTGKIKYTTAPTQPVYVYKVIKVAAAE